MGKNTWQIIFFLSKHMSVKQGLALNSCAGLVCCDMQFEDLPQQVMCTVVIQWKHHALKKWLVIHCMFLQFIRAESCSIFALSQCL